MRLLSKSAVAELVGYHAEHVMRLVREGKFPSPLKLNGHAARWREEDVHTWINAQPVKA